MVKATLYLFGKMSKFSSSPDRHTFQKEAYIKRKEEEGEEPSESYLDMFDRILEDAKNKWSNRDPNKADMEWDLVTTDWILEKSVSAISTLNTSMPQCVTTTFKSWTLCLY